MTLLLTGYEPFGDHDENPSEQMAHELDGEKIAGHDVSVHVLPVEFERTADEVRKFVEPVELVAVVATGLAVGRAGISVERVGINVDDCGTRQTTPTRSRETSESAPATRRATSPHSPSSMQVEAVRRTFEVALAE